IFASPLLFWVTLLLLRGVPLYWLLRMSCGRLQLSCVFHNTIWVIFSCICEALDAVLLVAIFVSPLSSWVTLLSQRGVAMYWFSRMNCGPLQLSCVLQSTRWVIFSCICEALGVVPSGATFISPLSSWVTPLLLWGVPMYCFS